MKILLIFLALAVTAAVLWWQRRSRVELVRTDGPVASWTIPDSWSIAQGNHEGKPLITRFNLSLRSVIGHASFGKQLGIAVPFAKSTDNGLPESGELEQLDHIEAEILRRFRENNESLFAGVITTGNMREFVLYTSNESAAVAKAEQLAKDIQHHEIQF